MAETSSALSAVFSRYLDDDGRTDAEVYLTGIYDGNIVASKWMRLLAEMMLPRFHEEYHGYHFEVSKAIKPVLFIERACVIPEGKKQWQPFNLLQFQKACIELAYGFVDENLMRQFQQVVYCLGRKNGKALAVSQELPTPNGWRKMGDLHVGDVVFGRDGKPSTIIAESEIFDKPTYLITFEDGASIKATDDHIWTVFENGDPFNPVDMTTVEILGSFEPDKYFVPLCKPVEYPDANLDEHPYDVGRRVATGRYEIPAEYLTASIEQRMAVFNGIRGLCDEVGCLNPLFESERVAMQVVELCSSLGKPCKIFRHGEFFGVVMNTNRIFKNIGCKSIVSIEHIPNEPSKCIAIDNQSHLYLVGRHYTATHNSSLIGGLGLFHLTSDGEMGGEVYCCATTDTQAHKVLGAADSMAFHSDVLKDVIRRGKSQKTGRSALNHDLTGSMLTAIAANPKKRDGASCSALIYDELAAVDDNGALLDIMEESMSARPQPVTWILSSENFIRGGVWDERISYCQGILEGRIHDDIVLPLLYTQDHRSEVIAGLEDPEHRLWLKSNPGLFEIKDADRLAQRVNTARQSPRSLPSVLTKEFCLRSGSYSAFLNPEDCINAADIDFAKIGIPPYVCVGFDLAVRNDLCSCVVRWKVPKDNKIYEIAKFWVASDMVNLQTDANQKDRLPYLLWSSKGQEMNGSTWHYVDIVEGDRVGMQCVLDFLNDLVNEGIYPYCIAYDPWHVGDLEREAIKRYVGGSRTLEVPPTMKSISPLIREHELDLKAHLVICPNPCLHHNRMSVQVREDPQQNVQVQKKDLQPHQKIDGFMAELFSLAAYNRYRDEYLSAIGWEQPDDN